MNQYHSFYQRLLDMECRKDIIIENKFLNKKIKASNTSYSKRFQTILENNKMRIYYLIGFCTLFSLNAVYDYIFYKNRVIPNLIKKLEFRQYPQSILEQNNPKINLWDQKSQQIARIFLKLEYQVKQITPQTLVKLNIKKQKPYEKQYVNLQSFVEYLKDYDLQQLRLKTNIVHDF